MASSCLSSAILSNQFLYFLRYEIWLQGNKNKPLSKCLISLLGMQETDFNAKNNYEFPYTKKV
jgi:hypothetical protein